MTRPAERPVLFSDAMVVEIIERRKFQTRRVISDPRNLIQKIGGSGDADNDPDAFGYFGEGRDFSGWMVLARGVSERVGNNQDRESIPCPYDAEALWVREAWRPCMEAWRTCVEYRANGGSMNIPAGDAHDALSALPKISLCFPGARKERHSDAWRPSIHLPRWASRISPCSPPTSRRSLKPRF